jgi:large subunit ribosomal protein L1
MDLRFTMAKKKPAETPETPEGTAAPETPAPAPEQKKEKKAKAKPDAKPDAPKGEAAPASAPVPLSAEFKPTAAPAPGEAKKKRRPGVGPRRGKKLRNQLKNMKQKIAKEGATSLKKAVSLLKSIKRAKFDETVEVHVALGIDGTQSDQMIRGAVSLPHGVGKTVRVLVFCQGDDVAKAKEAGADYAGSDEFIKKIQTESWLEFDVALAVQNMMGQVSRLGKTLGPRGLMPTPKAGTVIPAGGDISAAVREFKAGKVEYRSEKGGTVHAGVGKMSFDENKLADNITAFVDQIRAVKPSGVKGNYIKSITIAGTMTPGVPVTM